MLKTSIGDSNNCIECQKVSHAVMHFIAICNQSDHSYTFHLLRWRWPLIDIQQKKSLFLVCQFSWSTEWFHAFGLWSLFTADTTKRIIYTRHRSHMQIQSVEYHHRFHHFLIESPLPKVLLLKRKGVAILCIYSPM